MTQNATVVDAKAAEAHIVPARNHSPLCVMAHSADWGTHRRQTVEKCMIATTTRTMHVFSPGYVDALWEVRWWHPDTLPHCPLLSLFLISSLPFLISSLPFSSILSLSCPLLSLSCPLLSLSLPSSRRESEHQCILTRRVVFLRQKRK